MEPKVEVNGHLLTTAQAMTLRVALESFAMGLTEEGLGDDKHGNEIARLYLQRIREIRKFMYENV